MSKIPDTAITEAQLRKRIHKAIAKSGESAGMWAKANGMTPQTVSAFDRKVQTAGLQLPEVLGYRPQVIYIPLKEPLITTPLPPRRATDRPMKKVDHTRPPIERPKVVEEPKKKKKGKKK